jgi:creatinine amidohydrolase
VPVLLINRQLVVLLIRAFEIKPMVVHFDTPFIHADECETFSLALFPEMIRMEDAVDTK